MGNDSGADYPNTFKDNNPKMLDKKSGNIGDFPTTSGKPIK